MSYREVGGGMVRRYWCNNPHCPEPFHYSVWCPTTSSSDSGYPPLSPELEQAPAEGRRERRLRAEREAAQAPAAPEPHPYWWLWEAIPIGIVFALVMLVLVLH